MAFDYAQLHLQPGAVGDLSYVYDAGSDSMATVAAADYFLTNSANASNLAAEDLVWCQCSDGNMWVRVSASSATSVTTQFAGGNLPIQTAATGTDASLSSTVKVGFYEVGTSIATATRFVLPTPYPGAEIRVRRIDSGTQPIEFDAGGSGATAIVYDNTNNRRITTRYEGETFHVVGSSTTRWRVYAQRFSSSGSDDLGGGGSVAISGT